MLYVRHRGRPRTVPPRLSIDGAAMAVTRMETTLDLRASGAITSLLRAVKSCASHN